MSFLTLYKYINNKYASRRTNSGADGSGKEDGAADVPVRGASRVSLQLYSSVVGGDDPSRDLLESRAVQTR